MAEVGQRLTGAAFRLSAVTGGQSRPLGFGENPPPSPGSGAVAATRIGAKPRLDYTKLTSTAREPSEVRVRRSESWTGFDSKSLRQESSQLFRESVHRSGKVPPAWSAAWKTSWSPNQKDFLWSSEQLRTFCTAVYILADQAPGSLPRRRFPGPLVSSRSYTWSRDSRDAPMYRSRTAYYDVLQISPNATQSQIKTAYYKQSLIHHPDKNPGDPDTTRRFSEISEAYTVLGNINLRRKYDRGLLSPFDLQSAGKPSSKEAPNRPSTQRQQSAQSRRFSRAGGKTMFDFDAFYKAHYGEQLQREREMKARKEEMERLYQEKMKKWREERLKDVTLLMVLAAAGLLFVSLAKP